MRLAIASPLPLILSILVLLTTRRAYAFNLRPQRASWVATFSKRGAPSLLFRSVTEESKDRRTMVTPAAPQQRDASSSSSLAIGFFGKTGLFLFSYIFVKLVYIMFFTSNEGQSADPRCPWPFIVFHDPKQFMKDSPTWMIVTYVVLLRITKLIGTKGVAPA